MTFKNPLSSQSEVVNERRRWSQDWYTWLSDLITASSDLLSSVTTIQGDITTIQGDITTIQGDVTTIQGDITTIQGDITTIQSDITAIQAALVEPKDHVGFSNGSDAASGNIGEYLKSFVLTGSAVSVPTNTDTQITSLTLSAGDWDLWGEAFFNISNNVTEAHAAINTAVNSAPVVPADGVDFSTIEVSSASITDLSINGLRTRASITGSTTYRLVVHVIIGAGTVSGYGALRARRMR